MPIPDPPSVAELAVLEFVAARAAGRDVPLVDLCGGDEAVLAEALELAGDLRAAEGLLAALATRGAHAAGAGDPGPALLPTGGAARYVPVRELGRGAMGVVDEVRDPDLGRLVARKTMLDATPDSDPLSTLRYRRRLARFVAEARVLASLGHPAIPPVHEIGVDEGGRPYYTMPVLPGATLQDAIGGAAPAERRRATVRLVQVLAQVCEAVAHAHDHGVLHRDLKPQNIVVGPRGETFVVDWGLARGERGSTATDGPGDPLATRAGEVLGTPCYMAPEQARGAAHGPATDVYAAGAVLFAILTGRAPHAELTDTAAVLDAVRSGRAPDVARLAPAAPPELVSICARAMAPEPADRYPTMEALAADLRAYLETRVVAAHARGPLVELRKWCKRNPLTAASFALVGVAAISVALLAQRTARIEARANERLRVELYRSAVSNAATAIADGDESSAVRWLAMAPAGLRQLEWRFLDACTRRWTMRWDAGGTIQHGVTWSPDGTRILLAVEGRTSWWSPEGTPLATFATPGQLDQDVALVAGGDRIVCPDGRVLDAEDGRALRPSIPGRGFGAVAWSVCCDPTGPRAYRGQQDGTVVAFRTDSSESCWSTPALAGAVLALAMSHDGAAVIAGGFDSSLAVLAATDGALRRRIALPGRGVDSIAVGPDGRLATAGSGGAQVVEQLGEGPTTQLTSVSCEAVAWSPDGRLLAVAEGSATRLLEQTASGWREVTRAIGHRDEHRARLAFSPDGTRLLSAGTAGEILLADVAELTSNRPSAPLLPGLLNELAVGPAGAAALLAMLDRNTVTVWSLPPGRSEPELLRRLPQGGPRALDVSRSLAITFDHGELTLVSLTTGDVRASRAATHPAGARFVPGGVLTADAERIVRWAGDLASELWAVPRPAGAGTSPHVTPDGLRAVLLGNATEPPLVIDLAAGTHVATLTPPGGLVATADFSIAGPVFACGTTDGRVVAWDLRTGEERWRIRAPGLSGAIAFTDAGTRIVAGRSDGRLAILASASGDVLATVPCGSERIACVARVGTDVLAVAALDGSTRLVTLAGRTAPTGDELRPR
ncbi:MAG: protein kinase [Planctomycetes bacterium]|nr:protein kinase [Planctomycetota bacterium]